MELPSVLNDARTLLGALGVVPTMLEYVETESPALLWARTAASYAVLASTPPVLRYELEGPEIVRSSRYESQPLLFRFLIYGFILYTIGSLVWL